jgi:hypothetical protein
MSMRWYLAICVGALASDAACGESPTAQPDWIIIPGQRAGALDRTSNETQLVKVYGRDAVQPIRIELGEGETAPGTVLFATDSLRRMEVLWHDTVARARPARLVLRGRQSRWHLPAGVSLGRGSASWNGGMAEPSRSPGSDGTTGERS